VGEGLARLGLQAKLVCGDAADPARWWTGPRFDRILVDAPCTASGIVRRAPDARWLRRRGDLATLAAAQQRIVEALWPLLEPGGKLLYVTCSVFKAEGPQVIQSFLGRHRDARELALPAGKPQSAVVPGTEPGLQMLPTAWPSEDHDGFFYCLIEKLRP
jgi:16S rRNA (cytosine967-C5)-methyltransferase